jgi:hypothetical protein
MIYKNSLASHPSHISPEPHFFPFISLLFIMARTSSQTSNPKPKRKDLQRRIAELEEANRELDGM